MISYLICKVKKNNNLPINILKKLDKFINYFLTFMAETTFSRREKVMRASTKKSLKDREYFNGVRIQKPRKTSEQQLRLVKSPSAEELLPKEIICCILATD